MNGEVSMVTRKMRSYILARELRECERRVGRLYIVSNEVNQKESEGWLPVWSRKNQEIVSKCFQ